MKGKKLSEVFIGVQAIFKRKIRKGQKRLKGQKRYETFQYSAFSSTKHHLPFFNRFFIIRIFFFAPFAPLGGDAFYTLYFILFIFSFPLCFYL